MKQTTLCYIRRGKDVLMLHRIKKKNDANHDKWIGVGGHLEFGESPEECIVRETLEETGLTLTDYAYRGLVTFVSTSDHWCEYMHLFTAEGFTGTLRECDEGALEWIAWDRMLQLPMWEGDQLFLRLLETPCPFFSLKLTYDGDTLTDAALNGRPLALNHSSARA